MLLGLVGCGDGPEVTVEPDVPPGAEVPGPAGPSSLQRALEKAGDRATLRLRPGHYVLAPEPYTDPSCGNCEDPEQTVEASVGLRLQGGPIRIVGSSAEETVIHTGAGYGILFDECNDCSLEGVTVTGGARDADERATDAAVVVRESEVRIANCILQDNIGDPDAVRRVVVGIAGIVGREGSEIDVEGCKILRNSWDGIALYRGASATIRGNVIDGVDRATGGTIGGGRGVAIGMTWDSRGTVEGNLVSRYWKGIGVFVDAEATITENIVEDVVTWGIAFWDAGHGAPVATIHDNVVYRAGACGAALTRREEKPAPGSFRGNALVATGQDARFDDPELYCKQEPLAREAIPASFVIQDNLFHDNRMAGGGPSPRDASRASFLTQVAPLTSRLKARPALQTSTFLTDYGAGR